MTVQHFKQNDNVMEEEHDSDSELDFDEGEDTGEGNLRFNSMLMVNDSVSSETMYRFKDMVKRDNLRGNRNMILLLILLYFMSTMILIAVREIIENIAIIFVLRGIFLGLLVLVFIIFPLSFNQ